MSEYQYYEFRAVDRPLTEEQIEELRAYSGRARITSTSFANFYNWGNFKGDPNAWMEKYFDAFLHMANWGSRWFMLRIPNRLLDPDTLSLYCTDETLDYRITSDHMILSFCAEEVEDGWVDGEGWLDSLIALRAEVMQGDHCCLYLGWLRAVQEGMLADDDLEPPVPPGLATLNAPLRTLAEFLDIDTDLIDTASEKSEKTPRALSNEDIARWVNGLPSKDKDAVLTRLLEGDATHIAAELRQRALSEIRKGEESDSDPRKHRLRSVGELMERSEALSEERRRIEAERRAREESERERIRAEKRTKYLESLIGKENDLWTTVDNLITLKQPRKYGEAVSILEDLRDLAEMQGTSSEFASRMRTLYHIHKRKPSLIGRFRKAELPE